MSKITKSARDQDCQIRLPGICNFDPETTVFCHIGGGGMARKSNDIHGAYGCSSCHDAIDGRVRSRFQPFELQVFLYDGMVRTQSILLERGLIKIA